MDYQFCVSVKDAENNKWCPFAPSRSDKCISFSCMAWRWVETYIKDENGDLNVLSGDTHGICGLAGDPRVGKMP
jgi:hypothetical protein